MWANCSWNTHAAECKDVVGLEVFGDDDDDVGDKDSKSRAAGKKGKMGGFIEYNR